MFIGKLYHLWVVFCGFWAIAINIVHKLLFCILIFAFYYKIWVLCHSTCIRCFDAVGWAAGRAYVTCFSLMRLCRCLFGMQLQSRPPVRERLMPTVNVISQSRAAFSSTALHQQPTPLASSSPQQQQQTRSVHVTYHLQSYVHCENHDSCTPAARNWRDIH